MTVKFWPAVVSNVPRGKQLVLKSLSGSDGMKLWNLRSFKEIGYSSVNQDIHGAVSCAIWIKQKYEGAETLHSAMGLVWVTLCSSVPIL